MNPNPWCWLVLLLGLALAAAGGGAPREPVAIWEGPEATVSLEYRGTARAVFATGDFNDWTPRHHPFRWRGEDRWDLSLRVPAGEYAYLIAVESDEKWELKLDPANPLRTRDSAGRELSLLRVTGIPRRLTTRTVKAPRQGVTEPADSGPEP